MGNFFALLILSQALMAASTPGIVYHGRILRPDGSPLEGSNVQFRLQFRTPDSNNCLMYEEIQAKNMTGSGGTFSLTLNDGSGTRLDSTGYTIDTIFANRGTFLFASNTCVSGVGSPVLYAPGSSDSRMMQVYFKDETMSQYEPLPPMQLNFVPMAIESKQVGGFGPNNLLRFAESDGSLVNTSPLSNTQYNELVALVNGTSTRYARSAGASGLLLPAAAGDVSAPVSGSLWLDSTSHALKYYDGSSTQILWTASSSGALSASTVTATTLSGNESRLYKTDNGFYVSLKSPLSLSANYTLTLPDSPGSPGFVLATDGNGTLSWVAPATGTLTTVGVSAPLISTGGSAPTLSLTKADSTHDGYLAQGDWNAFHSKQDSTLNSGSLWVGNGSNQAAAVVPSGDAQLANTGVFTVTGVKGKTVTAAPTVAGQVLRYDGGNWTPNFVSMQDLRSNVTGSSGLAASCGSSQTLTYNSVGDNLTCANIAIAASQVSGLGSAATINAGAGANNLVQLDASGALPSVSGTALTGLNASNIANGTLAPARLPSSVILSGGNAIGASVSLGTTDNFGLNLATNNVPRVTVSNTGNVGIGTTSPSGILDLYSSSSAGSGSWTRFYNNNGGNNPPWTGGNASGLMIGWNKSVGQGETDLAFGTANGSSPGLAFSSWNGTTYTELMRISPSGNVGIGTTNPYHNLTLWRSGATPMVSVDRSGVGTMHFGVASDGTSVIGTNGGTNAISFRDGVTYDGDITSTGTERMRIDTNGNVGIGTNSPSATLHVLNNGTSQLLVEGNSTNSTNVSFKNTATGGRQWSMFSSGGGPMAAGGMGFWDSTASAARMVIDTSGNVGIGTTAPGSMLEVAGATSSNYGGVTHYNNVYQTASGPTTGTLKIVVPKNLTWGPMISVTIRGYDWSASGFWEVNVSGQVHGAGWSTFGASTILGTPPFTRVRMGGDGTNPIIMIGDTTTSWQYPHIVISDVFASYSTYSGFDKGWTSTFVTNETGLSGTDVNPKIFTAASGNVGIGTTAPNATLQVNGAIVSGINTSSGSFTCGTSSINFATGNMQILSPSNTIAAGTCAVTLSNMRAGGTYTLVMTGNAATNSILYTFSGYTTKFLPVNNSTIAGQDTIYTFTYTGTTLYTTWSGGYQ